MTREEARDAMFAHVRAAALLVPGAGPDGVAILWPDTPQEIPSGEPWIRPVIRHATGRQNALADYNGKRSFMHAGVLMVQLFTPAGDGMVSSDSLTQTFLTYFEGIRSSPVWYRNIRAMEIGKDGAAEQVNFLAEFQYDNLS